MQIHWEMLFVMMVVKFQATMQLSSCNNRRNIKRIMTKIQELVWVTKYIHGPVREHKTGMNTFQIKEKSHFYDHGRNWKYKIQSRQLNAVILVLFMICGNWRRGIRSEGMGRRDGRHEHRITYFKSDYSTADRCK